MMHELKCWPDYFTQVVRGNKTFEVRKNDRNFQEGDRVVLREWNPQNSEYTGMHYQATIGYVLKDHEGLAPGYCAFSLK